MVALMVRVPMTHNQRRRGLGASPHVSTRVVVRRISPDVARISPRLRVVILSLLRCLEPRWAFDYVRRGDAAPCYLVWARGSHGEPAR